jgi:hypothetical protein
MLEPLLDVAGDLSVSLATEDRISGSWRSPIE